MKAGAIHCVLTAALVLATGCDTLTGVLRDLPVRLDVTPNVFRGDTTIVARGDSVVLSSILVSPCTPARSSAAALMRGGALVVTVTDSLAAGIECVAANFGRYVATVRPAPAGAYRVQLVHRVVLGSQASSSTVSSSVVQLP